MADNRMKAQGRKMVESDAATLASVHSIADFITPVRPKLLVKLQVSKVAEVNTHKTLGQLPSPSATNSCQEEEEEEEGKEEVCPGEGEDRDWEVDPCVPKMMEELLAKWQSCVLDM